MSFTEMKSLTINIDRKSKKVKILINEELIPHGIIYSVDHLYINYSDGPTSFRLFDETNPEAE